MTDKVQLIKEEIEKRKQEIWPKNTGEMRVVDTPKPLVQGWLNALDWVLNIINSIQEEPTSEDLEGEIKSWIPTHIEGGNKYMRKVSIEWSEIVARHFAEWQRKKDQETIELAEDHAMLAGMNKMKEEMMKDAVESTVKYEIGSAEIPQCDKRYQVLSDPTPIANAKLGDKVKIIIVKTEQQ